MPNPFCYMQLHTRDAARARAFYREMFDWVIEEPADSATYAEVDPLEGPGAGVLQVEGPSAFWLPYVQVVDVEDAVQRARGLGAEVVLPTSQVPQKGTYAIVRDPTGATFALWKPSGP